MQKSLVSQAFFMRLLIDYLANQEDRVIWLILDKEPLVFLSFIHYYT